MESKINYTLVGLFVILLLAGLVIFVVWLERLNTENEYDYYHVYMNESVAGLNPDASVKYKGVNIGTVAKIGINSDNPQQVELLLKIKHGIKITQSTRATLKSFGITGLTFIELSGSSKTSLPLTQDGNKIPVIPSTPSIFSKLDIAFNSFTEKSYLALDKFNRLLNDDNLKKIADILVEAGLLIKETRKEVAGFHQLIENGVVMEKNAANAFKTINTASKSVHELSLTLKKNYANVGNNMEQDVHQSLELFNKLMYDMDILVDELQRTVQSFENSPSDLLFKKSQSKPGPGEAIYVK